MAPPSPGYAHALGAIGRMLDQRPARRASIVEHDDHFAVSWDEPTGDGTVRFYETFDLSGRPRGARLLAASKGGGPVESSDRQTLFDTLGWAMDRTGAELVAIRDAPTGLDIHARVSGRWSHRTYSPEQRGELVAEQRRVRAA
jgi:hypothetical protein